MRRGSRRRDRQQAISLKRGRIGNLPQTMTDGDTSFMTYLLEGVRERREQATRRIQKSGLSEAREGKNNDETRG